LFIRFDQKCTHTHTNIDIYNQTVILFLITFRKLVAGIRLMAILGMDKLRLSKLAALHARHVRAINI